MLFRSGSGVWRIGASGIATARPAGAAWSPLDLGAKLKGWWDFSDASTLFVDAGTTPVASDGDLIYQANDKSGNGGHGRQTNAAKRPLFKVAIQNGRATARFDGTNDFLAVLTATAIPANTSDYTVFFVSPFVSGKNGWLGTGAPNSNGNRNAFRCGTGIADGILKNYWYANDALASPAITPGDWHVYTFANSAGTRAMYLDGVALSVTTPGAATPTGSTSTPTLGSSSLGTGELWLGDFGEAICCDTPLSTANLNLLGNYLADKWGVPWTDIT